VGREHGILAPGSKHGFRIVWESVLPSTTVLRDESLFTPENNSGYYVGSNRKVDNIGFL
jgi:hypothetical protein